LGETGTRVNLILKVVIEGGAAYPTTRE
jgi:hypothetical protein